MGSPQSMNRYVVSWCTNRKILLRVTIYALRLGHVCKDNGYFYLNNLYRPKSFNINTVLNIITFIAETYLTSKRFE